MADHHTLTIEEINALPSAVGAWWPYAMNDRIVRLVREAAAAGRRKAEAELEAELQRARAECEELRKSLALVQQHHAVAWNRGHTMGVAASQQIVRQAKEAVARDAWGNTQLTEALLAAEAERDALRADAVVVIDGHQIRLADVLRRVLRNLTRKRGRPLWVDVHNLTTQGSTVSMGLCRWAGLDPDTGKEIPNA